MAAVSRVDHVHVPAPGTAGNKSQHELISVEVGFVAINWDHTPSLIRCGWLSHDQRLDVWWGLPPLPDPAGRADPLPDPAGRANVKC